MLAVAPMMDWTDRHCRYFHRQLSPSARLFSEMVTTGAIIHGDKPRHLDFNEAEHPVVLQLGGGDPAALTQSAEIAQQWGYDEVNLNVGCPSGRVQKNKIGACLMLEPELVQSCVAAMIAAVDIPVSVKCRLGVDDHDSYEDLHSFVDIVAQSGCNQFVVHARKALLEGLSPKANREIPSLKYEWVYQLKQDMPELDVTINGGIRDLESVREHLEHVDGVMIGRAAYQNPWLLVECERLLFDADFQLDREAIVQHMAGYAADNPNVALKHISRHMLGLFTGLPGARAWRRYISENAHVRGADNSVLLDAMQMMQQRVA
jgi:tRNA-dihydrouridine synthase A